MRDIFKTQRFGWFSWLKAGSPSKGKVRGNDDNNSNSSLDSHVLSSYYKRFSAKPWNVGYIWFYCTCRRKCAKVAESMLFPRSLGKVWLWRVKMEQMDLDFRVGHRKLHEIFTLILTMSTSPINYNAMVSGSLAESWKCKNKENTYIN